MGERLNKKTVLVVGASGNLGPSWILAALEEGAQVFGVGLRATEDHELDSISAQWQGRFRRADLDITLPFSLQQILDGLGVPPETKLDSVVMNAGQDSPPGLGKSLITDYDLEDWKSLFEVNVFGLVRALNAVVPALVNPSSIVMLGSLFGVVSPKPEMYRHYLDGNGITKNPAYGASKAALVAIARQYATHLANVGVRVNTLTLGGIVGNQDQDFIDKYRSHVPLGKLSTIEDVVGAMVFLLSNDSRAMTGHNLVVDGGYTAW